MAQKSTSLNILQVGDSANITGLDENPLSLQLLEMGFIPGEQLTVTGFAPFGDPIRLRLQGFELCIRKEDAALVKVELI